MIDLDGVLYPALFECLDRAFPEFGWVRDSKGWKATNDQATKSTIGAGKRRTVCHRPMGFYAHGAGFKTWIDYVSGERSPRGDAFIRAIKDLCERAGVTYTARQLTQEEIEEAEKKQKTGAVLEDIWQIARNELSVEDINARKDYLQSRDLNPEPDVVDVGYIANAKALCKALYDRGYSAQDISNTGLIWWSEEKAAWQANSLWDKRVVGKLVSKRLKIEGLWLRATEKTDDGKKYIYSTGFSWNDHAISKPVGPSGRVVLVEGVFEPEIFRGSDITAVGGTGAKCTVEFWDKLAKFGATSAVLFLDNDIEGIKGRDQAIANWRKSSRSVALFVAELPEECKDPDDCRRAYGRDEVEESIRGAQHVRRFIAERIVASCKGTTDWTDATKHDAIRTLVQEAATCDGYERTEYILPALLDVSPDLSLNDALSLMDAEQEKVREKEAFEGLLAISRALPRTAQEQGVEAAVEYGKRQLEHLKKLPAGKPAEIRSVAASLDDHKVWLNQYRGKGPLIGLRQGKLPTVDEAFMGLRGLIILPGPPNTGKSALGHQFGMDCVKESDDVCYVYVALEMSGRDHINRMWSRLAGMDYRTFRTGSKETDKPHEVFSLQEFTSLNAAEITLRELGSRILILDKSNFPDPTAEGLRQVITQFKLETGCKRCFVLVDYLQRFPVPKELEVELPTDLQKDDWRISQMEAIVTSPDDPVVVISAQAKHDSSGSFGKLAKVKGSGSATYSPDAALCIRPADDKDLYDHRMAYDIDKSKPPSKAEDLRSRLEELGVFDELKRHGWQFCWLEMIKGRDGMERFDLKVTFHYRQSTFTEGWEMPPVWKGARQDAA